MRMTPDDELEMCAFIIIFFLFEDSKFLVDVLWKFLVEGESSGLF